MLLSGKINHVVFRVGSTETPWNNVMAFFVARK